ncbi:unnamed protein product [Effrenium voratum]|nr:unnamed protein product [Effrenium voratum]
MCRKCGLKFEQDEIVRVAASIEAKATRPKLAKLQKKLDALDPALLAEARRRLRLRQGFAAAEVEVSQKRPQFVRTPWKGFNDVKVQMPNKPAGRRDSLNIRTIDLMEYLQEAEPDTPPASPGSPSVPLPPVMPKEPSGAEISKITIEGVLLERASGLKPDKEVHASPRLLLGRSKLAREASTIAKRLAPSVRQDTRFQCVRFAEWKIEIEGFVQLKPKAEIALFALPELPELLQLCPQVRQSLLFALRKLEDVHLHEGHCFRLAETLARHAALRRMTWPSVASVDLEELAGQWQQLRNLSEEKAVMIAPQLRRYSLPPALARFRDLRSGDSVEVSLGTSSAVLAAGILSVRRRGPLARWVSSAFWPAASVEAPLPVSPLARKALALAQRRQAVRVVYSWSRCQSSSCSSAFGTVILLLLPILVICLRLCEDAYARAEGYPGALMSQHPLKALTFHDRLHFELLVEQATLLAWKERAECELEGAARKCASPRRRVVSPLERLSPTPLDSPSGQWQTARQNGRCQQFHGPARFGIAELQGPKLDAFDNAGRSSWAREQMTGWLSFQEPELRRRLQSRKFAL